MMLKTISHFAAAAGLIIFVFCFSVCSQKKSSAQNNQSRTATKNADAPSSNTTPGNPSNESPKEIWSGASANFLIRWATDDLTAAAKSEIVFSARSFAASGYKQYYQSVTERTDLDKDLKPEVDFYNRHFKLLSIVGSLISFEDNLDASSKIYKMPSREVYAYRDKIESRFLTIDLAKTGDLNYSVEDGEPTGEIDSTQTGKAVFLTDLFSEQDILRALLNDAVIKRALSKAKKGKPPMSLSELTSRLEEQDLIAGNCVFYLPDDYLTRFAFHHIENNKIAVRLSLQPTIQACRGQKAQLGLLLPIPTALNKSLALADSAKQGFLMKRQEMTNKLKEETYVGFDENDAPPKKATDR